jgi:hypothetical protein
VDLDNADFSNPKFAVARVAPFAYFPPEEQQTTAATAAPQIASGRRRQLGTTAEVGKNDFFIN